MAELTEDVLLHYPRPQLRRDRWQSLDGTWGFAYDDENVGITEDWVNQSAPFDRQITVPFPPESPASGIGDPSYHPVVWYRLAFRVDEALRGERILLHFGAVDYRAVVWVNGQRVAEHEGGHTPFSADITVALNPGNVEQIVVVRAEDHPEDLTQPRGKQSYYPGPRGILYHRTTGIWQPVWLESVAAQHITKVLWTSNLVDGTLGLRVTLSHVPTTMHHVRVRLSLRGELLADDTFTVTEIETSRGISLPQRYVNGDQRKLQWSPEHPNLIDAELTLLDGDTEVDAVESYAGYRSVGVRDGAFVLNGRPYYLRMALEQGFWPESHLAAPSPEALKREAELAKALGFNGVRIHQKVEDPRYLSWCDRLGLLTWGEMANAYEFSATAVRRFTREWIEAVERDESHPCLVTWVPINESWGVPNLPDSAPQRAYARSLADLTRALDPTRPVISVDGWEHLNSDIIGVHDYARDADTIRERWETVDATAKTLAGSVPSGRTIILEDGNTPGAPLMLTEVGGIGYPVVPGERWHFLEVETPEELLAKYAEIIGAILESETVVGFCYTQITDTLQERNGLLDEHRNPKLPLEEIAAVTRGPSKAILG